MLEYIKEISVGLYRDIIPEIHEINRTNNERFAKAKTLKLLRHTIINNYSLADNDVAFAKYIFDKFALTQYLSTKKEVVISGEFDIIRPYCFDQYSNVESLTFCEGIEQIEYYALTHNEKIKEIVLPKSLSYVGGKAFGDCINLEKVSFGDKTKFADNPFINSKWSNSLQGDFIVFNGQLVEYRGKERHVIIPEGITDVVGDPFENNQVAEKITFPATLINLWSVVGFSENTKLAEVEFIGDALRLIGIDAFAFCTSLKEVVLPPKLEVLGGSAFNEKTVVNCKQCSSSIKNQVKNSYPYYID